LTDLFLKEPAALPVEHGRDARVRRVGDASVSIVGVGDQLSEDLVDRAVQLRLPQSSSLDASSADPVLKPGDALSALGTESTGATQQ
jgi:hypothetical protein